MAVVVRESRFQCGSADDAVLLGAWLLDGGIQAAVVAGDTVTVPGHLSPGAVIFIAETAFNRGWAPDAYAAAAIAQLDDRANHTYADDTPPPEEPVDGG